MEDDHADKPAEVIEFGTDYTDLISYKINALESVGEHLYGKEPIEMYQRDQDSWDRLVQRVPESLDRETNDEGHFGPASSSRGGRSTDEGFELQSMPYLTSSTQPSFLRDV